MPLYSVAVSLLTDIVRQRGANDTTIRLFMNNIGSYTDVPDGVKLLLKTVGVADTTANASSADAASRFTLSVGTDTPPSTCKNIDGTQTVPCAHVLGAQAIANVLNAAPAVAPATRNVTWKPITVPDVVAAVGPQYV